MASITFVYRASSRGSEHPGRLYLRLIHQRKVKMSRTPYKLFAEEWNNHHQKLVYSSQKRALYLQQIADYIFQTRNLYQEIIDTLDLQGYYDIDDIATHFYLHTTNGHLLGFVKKLSLELIKRGQERTARAYQTVTRGLIEFNKGKDIPLNHLNACLIKNYERMMKDKGKTLNTISFYMRNLRAIYNKAIREGYMEAKQDNPFQDVFTGFNKTRKRALNDEEIRKLHNLDFYRLLDKQSHRADEIEDYNLYTSWRLFFFCFYARGMSYVDMAYLRKDNIHGNIIRYYRKKTGQLIEVKITPKLQTLISSFSDDVKNSPYLFPIIQDSKKSKRLYYESGLRIQNKHLKRLAVKAGIQQALSTHVSRHSWATIAKKENLPLWVISEGLGHSNEQTTYTYLASFERSMLDHANDVISATVDRKMRHRAYFTH